MGGDLNRWPTSVGQATPVKYDRRHYNHRNLIDIMLGRLKDWRRIATRYDRCPTVFSAIALAATVIFWF